MIGYIQGTVIDTTDKSITVLAGDVGYEIYCPQSLLTATLPNDTIQIWIELVHREGAIELFGFADTSTRSLFRLLVTISGIGPRSALGILDYNSPTELRTAIRTDDISYLTKVSGIGKKTAEKILIELRDKMPEEPTDATSDGTSGDVVEALVAMGYHVAQARDAARQSSSDDTMSVRIKLALQFLNS